MFARLVRFSCNPGEYAAAQAIAEDLVPLIADHPGCHGVWVFGDEDSGDCGLFVLWDTTDNANAAAQIVRPKLDEHLAGRITGPPETRLFQVLSKETARA